MAYIYQVSFDIHEDQIGQLEIGAPLERTLGYLRILLPSYPGFITARAMRSMDLEGRTHLVFETIWDYWEDLLDHRQSNLSEDKVLTEFEPHVNLEDLQVRIFQEVD